MTQKELMDVLANTARGIAELLGPDTEVVLHDLTTTTVYKIFNGNITGRSEGYHMNPSVIKSILELIGDRDHVIGYSSKTASGLTLRASHFIYRNAKGKPVAMICINQDTARMTATIDYLSSLIALKPIRTELPAEAAPMPTTENYIQRMTQQAIVDSIQRIKPSDISTREGKMKLLALLRQQGIFEVKDAVPQVCKVLNISQATLYNYLRALREEPDAEA